jgi:hypothetical protein
LLRRRKKQRKKAKRLDEEKVKMEHNLTDIIHRRKMKEE